MGTLRADPNNNQTFQLGRGLSAGCGFWKQLPGPRPYFLSICSLRKVWFPMVRAVFSVTELAAAPRQHYPTMGSRELQRLLALLFLWPVAVDGSVVHQNLTCLCSPLLCWSHEMQWSIWGFLSPSSLPSSIRPPCNTGADLVNREGSLVLPAFGTSEQAVCPTKSINEMHLQSTIRK